MHRAACCTHAHTAESDRTRREIHHRIHRLGSHPAVCEWAIVRASRADAAAPLATFLDGLPVACYLLQGKSLPCEGAHGQRQSCRSVSRVARQALCMKAAGQAAVERWYRLRARAASTCLRASPVRGEFRPEPDLALQTRSGRAQPPCCKCPGLPALAAPPGRGRCRTIVCLHAQPRPSETATN